MNKLENKKKIFEKNLPNGEHACNTRQRERMKWSFYDYLQEFKHEYKNELQQKDFKFRMEEQL
ncbi:MAG: hypothetical protein ACRC1D_07010 [Culicoidibacterales bacterium]